MSDDKSFVDVLADEMAHSDIVDRAEDDTPTRHANAILDMSELQEIKRFFRWYDRHMGIAGDMPGQALRRLTTLPEPVVEWVVS